MAVAFDAVSTLTPTTSSTPSWTHTPVGTPTAVAVCFAVVDNSGKTVSSVTYGGAACSLVKSQTNGGPWTSYIYALASPASGPQTVAVTWSGTLSHGADYDAVTVTGSNTSTAMSNFGSGTGSDNVPTSTTTSTTNELVVDVITTAEGNVSATPTAGQTAILDNVIASSHSGRGSRKAGAASVTMSWTLAGSATWTSVCASFKEAGAAGGFIASSAYQNGKVVGAGVF